MKEVVRMRVSATEFKTRVGKYLELVDKEEIIITKNGREVAKLIPAKKEGTPNADFCMEFYLTILTKIYLLSKYGKKE